MAHLKLNKAFEVPDSKLTAEGAYCNRREFLKSLGASVGGVAGGGLLGALISDGAMATAAQDRPAQPGGMRAAHPDTFTPNNFVEFSHWSGEVPELARALDTATWPLRIGGLVERPLTLEAGDLIELMPCEQRICRMRCIEGWAMVVPWTGFPFRRIIELVRPESSARYVRFESFYEPSVAPGQRQQDWLVWPFAEALRLDEAAHELSFIAAGIYGRPLAGHEGAPLRLIVPWKYALKSLKSITRIDFVERRPPTFWQTAQPGRYDFECNVIPEIPRNGLAQREEIMIGTGEWQETRPFNGYGDLVSGLYR